MHNLFFIRRRFGKKANSIILTLALLSLSLLVVGVGLLLLTG